MLIANLATIIITIIAIIKIAINSLSITAATVTLSINH
jgi:hypothetical protein